LVLTTSAEASAILKQRGFAIVFLDLRMRLAGGNHMGVHLGRLAPAESQRLQAFLLSVVPVEA